MSGSAASKSKSGKETFDPDFQAKEFDESDDNWFQARFGTQKDDKTVAGATGKAPKRGASGQQKPTKKTGGSKCIAS
ncbi:hypothetical protein OIDMADRAFT_21007 [Oidiodendron maius Zn]|uniref:Uncharacterized protein n=1 Tax=Oidiodendron maius (strain Zn) TaxID=913774 RepID=A0A0C3GWC6_OIDMZ|nr:hypothetical protein OIDMADRAFT_21007 [Oidiodendron maius Zn]